ncbi:MAG: hypothetical protein KatS3mg031_2462 [Chitinophagales bacterium]|nr:MAG: hypothetical protein KatS3mg031_2462 [Chitinophagales bacterium]
MIRALILFVLLMPLALTAQFTDDFGDGDFTSNPAWQGIDSAFVVVNVAGNNRLRSNSTVASSDFYLSTASSLVTNCQWEFFVHLAFNTSSANYVDIYLTSDSADLRAASNNGYFVRIGNTADEVSLYRKTGTTVTKIVDGTDGLTNTSNNLLKIRVTRDTANVWTLERDITGTGNSYVTEGTVTDASILSGSYFGVYVVQSTASFFQKHYFDDFYVGPIVEDTVPPRIASVVVTSSATLDVLFTEPVEKLSSELTANYFVNQGIGAPTTAQRDTSDSAVVHLVFAGSFTNGVLHTLTVSNVQDIRGNVLASDSRDFLFFIPDTPALLDVIINELLPDPDPPVQLPAFEFVELFNRSSKVFDLSGWVLSDGSSNAVLGSRILFPGEYLIVCPSAAVSAFTPFGSVLGVSSFPSLNNTGDNITLKTNQGLLIDRVSYTDSWYRDAAKENGGWTLERIDPNYPCEDSINWKASADTSGGTPGKINSVSGVITDTIAPSVTEVVVLSPLTLKIVLNEQADSSLLRNPSVYAVDNGIGNPDSVVALFPFREATLYFPQPFDSGTIYTLTLTGIADCSGNNSTTQVIFALPELAEPFDIIFNELIPDPDPSVGLPSSEFVELYNRSAKVINLGGWMIRDATSSAVLTNMTMFPGDYVILCPTADKSSFQYYGKVMGLSLPSLNNSGDVFSLYNDRGVMIDQVNYSDSWYRDDTKSDGGWTLERIDPDFLCPAAGNWAASVDVSGGTPGRRNSIHGVYKDTIAPQLVSVRIAPPDTLKIVFSEEIDSLTALMPSNYSVDNGIGNPMEVLKSGSSEVWLVFAVPFDTLQLYQLQIGTVTDCPGNPVQSAMIRFGVPRMPAAYDVLITEIMADPEPTYGLPPYEYVELYNRSDKIITLSDLIFSDASQSVNLSYQLLLPDEYVILCGLQAVEALGTYGRVQGTNLPALTNAGEPLTLRNSQGIVIHHVEYSDTWYTSAIKMNGGFSLEMVDYNNPCTGRNNWRESIAPIGGTPGAMNSVAGINPDETAPTLVRAVVTDPFTVILYFDESLDPSSFNDAHWVIEPDNPGIAFITGQQPAYNQIHLTLHAPLMEGTVYTLTAEHLTDCSGNPIGVENAVRFGLPQPADSGDVIINEVLFNPYSGGVDFVELYNRSSKVIDLKECIIAEGDVLFQDSLLEYARITTTGFQLLPKAYVALTSNPDVLLSQYYTPHYKGLLKVNGMPNYPDKEGVVLLLDTSGLYPQGRVFDKLHYHEDWHLDLLDDEEGVSLERISFDRPTQDEYNWHSAASAVGYATPAYQNSQWSEAGSTMATVVLKPEIFSPDNDGFEDFLQIYFMLDEPGYVVNVTIFDDAGRVTRQLVKNWLLGKEDVIVWDGITDDGRKARLGYHVVVAELFNLKGEKRLYKKTCVVAGRL